MKQLFILIGVVVLTAVYSFGQKKNKGKWDGATPPSLGLLVGYNFYHHQRVELGIGYQPVCCYAIPDKKPFGGFALTYSFPVTDKSTKEFGLSYMFMARPIAFGLNVNNNFNDTARIFGLKPMIGFSHRSFAIMWGYNIFLSKNNIEGLKHGEWTFRTYIPIIMADKTKWCEW